MYSLVAGFLGISSVAALDLGEVLDESYGLASGVNVALVMLKPVAFPSTKLWHLQRARVRSSTCSFFYFVLYLFGPSLPPTLHGPRLIVHLPPQTVQKHRQTIVAHGLPPVKLISSEAMKDSIHVSKENYLKAILEAEAEGRQIPAMLAHWLEVSAPAVTMALKRLKRDGS